jgi:hypothetical protein
MSENKMRLRADAYAVANDLSLLDPLGNGVDGNVWKVIGKKKRLAWAVKLHRHKKAYELERDCYKRLSEYELSEVCGGSVPQLIRYDDEWMAIEMSIVDPPFILDFAGAFLDLPPDFPDEIWEESEAAWEELYGDAWPRIKVIRSKFEEMGIYLTDLHSNNISPE